MIRGIIALLLLTPSIAFAGSTYNPFTGKQDKCVTIEEVDGSPSNIACGKVKVSNSTLTDNGDGTFSLSTGSGGGVGVGIGTTSRVPVYLDSTTIGSPYQLSVDSSGNLGIGTDDPTHRLTVVRSGAVAETPVVSSDIMAYGDGSAFIGARDVTNNIEFAVGTSSVSSSVLMGAMTAHDLSIRTNNAERIRISSTGGNVGIGTSFLDNAKLSVVNGNVGIGTWKPAGLFQVGRGTTAWTTTAAGAMSSAAGTITINSSTTHGTNSFIANAGNTTGFAYNCTNNSFTSGGCFFATSAGVNMTGDLINSTYTANKSAQALNVGIGTLGTGNALRVINQGTGHSMLVEDVASDATPFVITNAGNVGIGVTTPGQLLHVKGASARAKIESTGGGDPVLEVAGPSFTNYFFVSQGDGGWHIRTDSATRPVWIQSLGSQAFGISEGNVGIGGLQGSLPNPTSLVVMNGNTNSSTAGLLDVRSYNATSRFLVRDDGNIGIGTVSPFSELSVVGGVGIGTGKNTPYVNTNIPDGNLSVQGNVGIGSVVASSRLTIATSQLMQKVSVANTACNTTCGQMGCYFGTDTAILGTLVDCADATADVCFCSK